MSQYRDTFVQRAPSKPHSRASGGHIATGSPAFCLIGMGIPDKSSLWRDGSSASVPRTRQTSIDQDEKLLLILLTCAGSEGKLWRGLAFDLASGLLREFWAVPLNRGSKF